MTTKHSGPPTKDQIQNQLETIFDPEIPVNIVDLGLVYSIQIKEKESNQYTVEIKITLTSLGCMMGPSIVEDVKRKVMLVPGVSNVIVDIVWDPPWTQDMISEQGKMQLGLI
jgi:metal-sulfur cluster biosynthetic enzyme